MPRAPLIPAKHAFDATPPTLDCSSPDGLAYDEDFEQAARRALKDDALRAALRPVRFPPYVQLFDEMPGYAMVRKPAPPSLIVRIRSWAVRTWTSITRSGP